jgi:diacylglycerol kinase
VKEERQEETLRRGIQSLKCALKGIGLLLRSQVNARIQAATAAAVVVAGLILHLSSKEWCWIILAISLVLTAEALNTALEFLTDLVTAEYHPLAEKVKDVAAGAVLIAATGALILGLLVFGPKVITLMGY